MDQHKPSEPICPADNKAALIKRGGAGVYLVFQARSQGGVRRVRTHPPPPPHRPKLPLKKA